MMRDLRGMAARMCAFMKASDSGTSQVPKYLTRELSKKTWPDFERLFETHPRILVGAPTTISRVARTR
jgi:hypothetical protein